MTSRTRGIGTKLAVVALTAATAVIGPAGGAAAQAPLDPAATRVVGECKPGPGRIAMTVLPTGADTYQVTIRASRLPDDSRWKADFVASNDSDDSEQRFRRRAVDGSWSITTEVALPESPGPAFFSVFARTSPRGRNLTCLVQASPHPRVIGASLCARGFHALLLRRRDDGTLVARPFVVFVAPDTRWRLELSVASANEAQLVATEAVSNRRGVVRSRFELSSVPEDSVFTVRAASERGARCRLRINPGPLSTDLTGQAVSPRQLIRLGSGTRS